MADTAGVKITVILPVYNVAEYLPRCLDSIDRQTCRSFRLIAVNDGATDNSPEILRDFAADHPYVTIIDQENQGLSAARNTGLAAADTEYVSFIDSDDFVEPTFLEELLAACEEHDADIACCFPCYYYVDSGRKAPHPFRCSGVFSRDEILRKLLQDTQVQSYAWNKLYRRRLFTENDILYPKMAFEDMSTTLRLFQKTKRVAVIDRSLYYYVQRKTSILKTPNPKKINDFIRATASMRMALEATGEYEQFRKYYGKLTRKTHFYCLYYLTKIHVRSHTFWGYFSRVRKIGRALRYYKSSEFHPTPEQMQDPASLPDTLDPLPR